MKLFVSFLLITFFTVASCSLLEDEDNTSEIPGKIVFSAKNDAGTSQIFVMNADGSDVRQLTRFPDDGGGVDPVWSPDGQRIAFANYTEATTLGPYLYIMDADGDNMRLLKRRRDSEATGISALIGSAPAWSPDGTQIAFQVCTNCEWGGNNYEISVVEAAGENYDPAQHQPVTSHPASDTHPTWSPDGTRIAFTSDRAYANADTLRYRKDLYAMNLDGSKQRRLTETGYAREPKWKPVGDTLIFRSTGSSPGLYEVYTKSSEIVKVKNDLKNHTHLHPNSWSSDGSQLLIIARQLDPPHSNSIYLFDIVKNNFIKIYSKFSDSNSQLINGADLYIP